MPARDPFARVLGSGRTGSGPLGQRELDAVRIWLVAREWGRAWRALLRQRDQHAASERWRDLALILSSELARLELERERRALVVLTDALGLRSFYCDQVLSDLGSARPELLHLVPAGELLGFSAIPGRAGSDEPVHTVCGLELSQELRRAERGGWASEPGRRCPRCMSEASAFEETGEGPDYLPFPELEWLRLERALTAAISVRLETAPPNEYEPELGSVLESTLSTELPAMIARRRRPLAWILPFTGYQRLTERSARPLESLLGPSDWRLLIGIAWPRAQEESRMTGPNLLDLAPELTLLLEQRLSAAGDSARPADVAAAGSA